MGKVDRCEHNFQEGESHLGEGHFFLLLNFSLYGYTIIRLTIHLLINIYNTSKF